MTAQVRTSNALPGQTGRAALQPSWCAVRESGGTGEIHGRGKAVDVHPLLTPQQSVFRREFWPGIAPVGAPAGLFQIFASIFKGTLSTLGPSA